MEYMDLPMLRARNKAYRKARQEAERAHDQAQAEKNEKPAKKPAKRNYLVVEEEQPKEPEGTEGE